jgi:hypothetical protein
MVQLGPGGNLQRLLEEAFKELEHKRQELVFGGDTGAPATGATEEYNGICLDSWRNSLNTAKHNLGGAGTQTAALGFGGRYLLLFQVSYKRN